MQRIQRIWSANLVGKVVLVACGLLLLLVIIGIPVGVISLLSSRRNTPSPSAAITGTIPVTIYPFPTDSPEPTPRPTPPPTLTSAPAVTPTSSPAPTTIVTPTTPITVQLTVSDTNDFVNVRSGPGVTFPLLGTLNKGQKATVTGRIADGTWWQIVFNGKPGWVYGLAVKIIGDASHVPVVKPPSG